MLLIQFFYASSLNLTKEEKEYLKTNPIVSIGSIDSYSPFSFIKNNVKVGLSQDLLEIISEKTGIQFRKVGGTWPEVYTKFKIGELDMISELSYRKDRLSFTNYTNPYYEIPIGIFTKKSSSNHLDLDSLKGKRVGIVKDSYLLNVLQKMDEIELVLIDSSDERFLYLTNDKVDVVLSNALSLLRIDSLMLQDIKLSGYFKHPEVKSEDLRFGIAKKKKVLSSIINKALDSISYAKMTELRNEWILGSSYTNNNIVKFSQDERAWIEKNEVIVGIENTKPYIYFDETTQDIEGLYADIFKIVLKNTGLQVKYVEGSWAELLQKFKEKKIDILPATFYKKSREDFGNFTTEFYKVREYGYTQKEKKHIKSFKDLQNRKVAIVKSYATIDKIKERYPNINIIETANLDESMRLLSTQKVDAIIDYHLVVENYIRENLVLGLKSISQNDLSSISVHFFSILEKPILNTILQRGLESISREERNTLLNSWFRTPFEKEIDPLSLTNKEKLFLKKHPKIRFRVRTNRPPFEFDDNGKASGIVVEYVKKSATNMGLDVEFIFDNSDVKSAYETISTTQKRFDSLLYAVKNKDIENNFSFGGEFLSYPLMIIINKSGKYLTSMNDLTNRTVVLEEGFAINKWLKEDYPFVNIRNVSDTEEALRLVNTNKDLVYIGNLAVANYLSTFGGLDNIKISAPTPYENIQYSFIAPKKWPELASILTKGFKKIKPVEHTNIQQKWFSLQTIEKTNYDLLWKIVALGFLIIIWILWWNRKITIEKDKTKIALLELQKAQLSLKNKIKEQLEQQQLLLNQSKIASMGEMLANIAHQWRQPLSVISTASTGLLVEKQFHAISDEKLEKTMNTINEHAQYLSTTINTFSDYIKSNKEIQRVLLHERIQIAINIVEATFKNHYIALETNLHEEENIEMDLAVGELSEAVINILNNAKDAIIQNKIENPLVKINLQRVVNTAIISIEDNAGGIPSDIISKIFEPYFTTKHQTQGTGLGLHMSYKIVTESLNGTIKVSNTNEGAKFIIELPLK